MKLLVALTVLCLAAVALALRREQKVSVEGRVVCNSDRKQGANVLVKLVDEDRGGMDDEMGRTRTNANGEFFVSGKDKEFGRIDPRLQIYHNCNDKGKPCKRKWKMEIPKSYINGKTFNAGTLSLDMKLPDEDRDCIH